MGVSSTRQPRPTQPYEVLRLGCTFISGVLQSLALSLIGITWLSGVAAGAERHELIPAHQIGLFIEVQGHVRATHPGAAHSATVNLYDRVRFRDVIETQRGSQAKALFFDDSLLTIGEHSRVEITEYLFDPARDKRCLVVKLVRGVVRVLVGKVFTGKGSKFEIHTPSAVAAARGTYFVVWADGRSSGVVNIGDHGRVDFTAKGLTVGLGPHQFSFSKARTLPTRPTAVSSGAPAGAWKAVKKTEALVHRNPAPLLPATQMAVMPSSTTVSTLLWSFQDSRQGRVQGPRVGVHR